jgi:hypothetical protein
MYRDWAELPVVQALADALNGTCCDCSRRGGPFHEPCRTGFTIHGRTVGVNHAIGTLYAHENDNIGPHNDKMADLHEDAHIVTFSFGARRELHLHNGRDLAASPYTATEVVVMEPDSLFFLSPETNRALKHSIVTTDKHLVLPRTTGEEARRSSLIFREVMTLRSPAEAQKGVEKAERDAARRRTQKAPAPGKK